MNGSIRRRGKGTYELTIDLGKDSNGRRQRKFVNVKGTRKEADRKLRELAAAVDSGTALDLSKVNLSEFLERWMTDYVSTNTAPSTQDGYGFIVRCHLILISGTSRLRNYSLRISRSITPRLWLLGGVMGKADSPQGP